VVQARLKGARPGQADISRDYIYFGCTDQSQAIRQANWYLLTEKYNSVTISYRAYEDHFDLVPGDIVEFEDSGERFNQRFSGRVLSRSGAVLTLDGAIDAAAGDGFSVTLADGSVFTGTISTISGVTVTLNADPGTIADMAVFIAAPAAQGRQLYRVIAIDETSTSEYSVTIQSYKTEKFTDTQNPV
jgi:predicted phage tail protein